LAMLSSARQRKKYAAAVLPSWWKRADWLALPDALLVGAVRQLPIVSLCAVPQVCRAWRATMDREADPIIKDAVRRRFPYLGKLIVHIPQPHDYPSLYREQRRAKRPPALLPLLATVDNHNRTLEDFIFTIIIKEAGVTTFDWSGRIPDPLQATQLWADADAPAWCTDDERLWGLTLDVLVSKLTPRGLRTLTLCRAADVDTVEDDEYIYFNGSDLPMNCVANAILNMGWLAGGENSCVAKPLIPCQKDGGGGMVGLFRSWHGEELEDLNAADLLKYLMFAAPWGSD